MLHEINDFLDWKATHAKRASENYRIWLVRFAKFVKKGSKEVSIQDIVKFQLHLEGKYAPPTVQFAMTSLKVFFRFQRMLGKKCLAPELIRPPKSVAKSHRAIEGPEFLSILEAIPNTYLGMRDLVMVRILYDTGIRVSELCELNVTDIDAIKTFASIVTKKSQQRRIIVWSRFTHSHLLHYIAARNKISADPALFTNLYGERLTARTVERNLKRYVQSAGLQVRITPHSFRHGWAHLRRDQNAPLSFIQKGLGHQSPTSTFIYEQYHDEDFLNRAEAYFS